MNRNLRKERIGVVTSNKMDKSIVEKYCLEPDIS